MRKSLLLSFKSVVSAAVIFAASAFTASAETIELGYVSTSQDQPWPGDGLAYAEDTNVYAAIILPIDIIKAYAGGRITGLKVGWASYNYAGNIEAFVREGDLNAENSLTQSATIKFGWNTVKFDKPYSIPEEPGDIIVGYRVGVKAEEYCIPYSVLGLHTEHSCYVTNDDLKRPDGTYQWQDGHNQLDNLLILALIEIDSKEMDNRAEITNIVAPEIFTQGNTGTGQFTIANRGTNAISTFDLVYKSGNQTETHTITPKPAIKVNTVSKVFVPIPAMTTGEMTVDITKVNGKENAANKTQSLPVLTIPEEVAAKYTRRTLLEYYGSEASHYNPLYYDDYIVGTTADYIENMSILCHHPDDQFMTRDNEDIQMLTDLADGDTLQIQIPCMTLDRSIQANNYSIFTNKTVAYSVLMPNPITPAIYEEALAVPTFANLSVMNFYNPETAEVAINVTGHIEPGILPDGEKLKLTVYLLEDNVASKAQNWATAEQEEAYGGVFIHQNLIRMQPTPMWGVELDGDGDFARSFTTEIDPEEWKFEDMHILAVLHRSEKNARLSRQVINCAEDPFDLSSIDEVTLDAAAKPQRVFTLSGAEVIGSKNIPAGIYIVTDGTAARKILVK